MLRQLILGLLVVSLCFGCTRQIRVPNLGELYNRAAQYHGLDRNPIIVLPGVLGSRLQDTKTDKIVWGAFTGDFVDPKTDEGARTIALPMREGVPLLELRDSVVSIGALDRVQLRFLGIPVTVRAYAQILGILGIGGFRDEELGLAGAVDYGDDHFTCFQFHYDWRRDNAESAALLYHYILEKREYVFQELKQRFGSAPENLRFDIIAHSMGGLVLRYMLRYGDADLPADGSLPPITWKGAELVDRVILVATPNAGTIQSLIQLVEGYRVGPFLPEYEARLLGTFPSIYQLLPRSRHQPLWTAGPHSQPISDILDSELWQRMGWGLASPQADPVLAKLLPEVETAEERRRIALDHLGKCLERARRFSAALDAPSRLPDDLAVYLFVGDAVPTPAVAEVSDDGSVRIVRKAPGDGIVLRSSVLFDQRLGEEWSVFVKTPIEWTQLVLLFTDHLDITRDPAFADNLLYLLLEDPRW